MDEYQTILSRIKNLSKKQLAVIAIILAVVIIAIAVVLSFTAQKRRPQVAKPAVATAIVTISKNGFVPATLSIKKSQTVEWVNNDDVPHRVASNPHPTHTGLPGFDSKNN